MFEKEMAEVIEKIQRRTRGKFCKPSMLSRRDNKVIVFNDEMLNEGFWLRRCEHRLKRKARRFQRNAFTTKSEEQL